MGMKQINRKLQASFGDRVSAAEEEDRIVVSGHLGEWKDIIKACSMCVQKGKKQKKHVVNRIVLDGVVMPKMRIPAEEDTSLEGDTPDVLIIGGGISGVSIARELSRWKLDILLVEKEADLAVQASGRNDGEVHPGVDLKKGSLKQHYVLKGNRMYDRICEELDVPFDRCGQYVGFTRWRYLPAVFLYYLDKRYWCGVKDTRLVGGKKLHMAEPELNPDFKFAIYNSSAGCVCPYGLTIAYGENAVSNGVRIKLNTAVLGMEVKEGRIISADTNRGRIYPRLVINAAGAFAEDVAVMAGDPFYSIHPRKGTNSILDKKAGHLIRSIASVKTLKRTTGHTKGGGLLHTVDGNVLVGPDAEETWEKENFATSQTSVDRVFAKQRGTAGGLSEKDIITYFTGVRAAAFEEDFIIERGRKTGNLIHCAGIQSPGLTTAPAVAEDVAGMAAEFLSAGGRVEPNPSFNPRRKGVPRLRELPREERDRLIRENPDYGVIICRCEEISKGEIEDALDSPLPVCTVDGIKKRLRPGMGRCQGGFCQPLVTRIISEHEKLPLSRVRKAGGGSIISYGPMEAELSMEAGHTMEAKHSGEALRKGGARDGSVLSGSLSSFPGKVPETETYDVLVIGGGPAGLAAAIEADKEGACVLLAEREERLGGILKQCIHDGFGLLRFGRLLTGPEYAEHFVEEFLGRGIACRLQAFVSDIRKEQEGFRISLVDRSGVTDIRAGAVVLATGCRERTARQVFIHGTRPSGIFTAGTAQHFVNLLGEMITRRCVILGSGDIGLIMARRLTLEGATVLGVYEAKPEPSGLTRNIRQCLEDYNIPLYLSSTVTRVYGEERLTGVEIARVDERMKPVAGTEKRVACDALVLSVGLIPENEIAQRLGVTLDRGTKGPVCDNTFMTDAEGVFTCGNAMHVNDLVDYVSESGELAGKYAARYACKKHTKKEYIEIQADDSLLYVVPQRMDIKISMDIKTPMDASCTEPAVFYFRSSKTMEHAVLSVSDGNKTVFEKAYEQLKPPEMKHFTMDLAKLDMHPGGSLHFSLKGGGS